MQFLGGRTYGVSYVQDGQASTNAIFGTVGNSAPGLDAIAEVQVLSNSYSAEYGGLAGVVVTTKRGGNRYHGTTFYDYNSDDLNALTYAQKASRRGARRPELRHPPAPLGREPRRTARHQQDLLLRQLRGLEPEGDLRRRAGSTSRRRRCAPATSRARRSRSGTRSPGQPFPGNVIPANRLDPTAQNILNFFYPLPNQGTLATGMGVYQQFVPETRNRHRADLRIDHEADAARTRCSCARATSAATRRASRSRRATRSTNLGIQDRTLDTATVVGGWTKIFSNTVVNEFRVGYNYDNSVRQSQYNVQRGQRASSASRPRRASTPTASAIPSFSFSGGSAASRPVNITDGGLNADRTINQNSFSISDNLSWVVGSHSLRGGALWTRNSAIDGRGRGTNHRGQYRFNGARTGNALADLLLGYTRDVADRVIDARRHRRLLERLRGLRCRTTGGSTTSLTVFLGLRYELVGRLAREGRHPRRTSSPRTAATTSCRTRRSPPCCRPACSRSAGRGSPSDVGHAEHPDQHRQEQLQPARRLRLARRRQRPDGRCAAASGSSTRRWPSRALRDLLASNMFRYGDHAARRRRSPTASAAARRTSTPPTSATRASTPTSRARTSTSTT